MVGSLGNIAPQATNAQLEAEVRFLQDSKYYVVGTRSAVIYRSSADLQTALLVTPHKNEDIVSAGKQHVEHIPTYQLGDTRI